MYKINEILKNYNKSNMTISEATNKLETTKNISFCLLHRKIRNINKNFNEYPVFVQSTISNFILLFYQIRG